MSGQQGDIQARTEALDLLEGAIDRGGRTSWFNRLRLSLNRHLSSSSRQTIRASLEYPQVLIHVFDDYLERLGRAGTRFQMWSERLTNKLNSSSHGEYQEGLEDLGHLLAYSASRPRYSASTDCRWRGIFGNIREVVTFEAKIEHVPSNSIIPRYVGQAHNQLNRATQEYGERGYIIRGTIVTHIESIDDAARSSLGELRIIPKQAVIELWNRVFSALSQYRDNWSLEDVDARIVAAELIIPRLPPDGWLTQALTNDGPFISESELLAEWP